MGINNFSAEQHPFILADNRHYAFYLNQRMFRRLPGKVIGAGFFASAVATLSKLLDLCTTNFLIYTLATFCTLIPTSLLEFRYYLIPYLIWRLRQSESILNERSRVLEVLWWLAIQCTTIYVFLYKPFYWPDTDSVQRFMW